MCATADKSAKIANSDNTDKTANSQKPSERELSNQKFAVGLSGAFGCLVFIIFIFSIESVIDFTNNDVQDVCPHSQLWWATLFMGIVFPLLLIVSAVNTVNAAKSKKNSIILRHVFIWICPLTVSIIWGLDQLWGVPGFANDTCVYDNFGTENTTCENNNKGGHNLFLAVTNWIIIYIYLLVNCGITVVKIYQEEKKNGGKIRDSTTLDKAVNIV